MLQAIRDRVTGWIAGIIVGLIVITFALWGIDSYLKEDGQSFAAKVNGIEISDGMLANAVQRQRIQIQRSLGEDYDPSQIDEKVLRKRVLDSLIEKQLVVQAAEDSGFAISDQLLASRIQNIPDLQVDGAFSMELYESLLRQQGLSPIGFEIELRRDLLSDQLLGGISRSLGVSDAMVDRVYALQAQQREVSYLTVSAAHLSAGLEFDANALEAYFAADKDRFRAAEKVRIEYVELKRAEVAAEIDVDEAMVERFYQENLQRWGTEEQRRARHVLVQLSPDADDAAVEAAREKAQAALERIRAGEDFAAVAKDVSDDPGSAAMGGDLGFFGKGMMVPAFDDAVFGMEKGSVSDLVKSSFGFHIIEVTDIKAGETKPLAEVRNEVLAELRAEDSENIYLDRFEILANSSYENPDSLVVAAEALGLEINESGWITRAGGDGVATFANVVSTAFSEDVLVAGNNSEPLEVEPGHVVVLRVLEHEPARYRELDEVRDQVEAGLRAERAQQAAATRAEEMLVQLQEGATMATLAEQSGIEYQAAGLINRAAADLPADVVAKAFRLPRPDAGNVSRGQLTLGNGDAVVVAVSAVKEGDAAVLSSEERVQARQLLMRVYGGAEVNALVEALKAQAEIEITGSSDDEG